MRAPPFPDTLPGHLDFDPLAPGRRGAALENEQKKEEEKEEPPLIDFTPVARRRRRGGGWTEDRQRGFIAALARCGSVSAAARAVGMTARTAYRLVDAPDAASFARAWDMALDIGHSRQQTDSLQRALDGDFVPVYRRGKLVQVEHRRNDRLAIALLSGRRNIDDNYRRTALSKHEHRVDLAALDAARAAHKAQIEEADIALRAEIDRLILGIINSRQPRIVAL